MNFRLLVSVGLLSLAAPLAGCGAKVVFDTNGGAGPGGSGPGGAGAGAGTSTGTTGCTTHAQCPQDQLCIFATGECAPACTAEVCDACGPGAYCEPCATSFCPDCLDCRAACLPLAPGRCDDDDPCQNGQVCLFSQGVCADACAPGGSCPDFTYCEGCATGSCCGCDNCVSACLGGE